MKHTIVANIPAENEALMLTVETDNDDVDPVAALRDAAKEFVKTPEGKAYLLETSGDYNWGDIASSIPDEITEKHGVLITTTSITHHVVDHDEKLNTED